MKLEKNAGLIMGTNKSSIVSKRSVERLYYPEPHFFRYFVRKPLRRSPTINRGYWLRMQAIEHVVRQFLHRPSKQQKVVLNLGAGYDPMPFQWLSREPDLCNGVRFVDVDHQALIASKIDIVLQTERVSKLLSMSRSEGSGPVMLTSNEYIAIGCDLRDIAVLDPALRSIMNLQDCLVLCIAEVSVTYMTSVDADALIKWTTTLSEDVMFCLLEQYLADGEDHPFAVTMLKHFEKLQTPLRTIHRYPALHSQLQRFYSAGFESVEGRNLWDLWSDPGFLSVSQRLALDAVEPFDEWEEFALFASHYFLLTARTRSPVVPQERDESQWGKSDVSTKTTSAPKADRPIYGLDFVENPRGRGRVHHGSAIGLGGAAVAIHGGIGPQTRLGSTEVYGFATTRIARSSLPPKAISPRSCHTITNLSDGQAMLVGGRASPTVAMQDCWLRKEPGWTRTHDLPMPRYRHTTAPITLPLGGAGLLVFGGKDGTGFVHTTTLIWQRSDGWRTLEPISKSPTPRFGAALVSLGRNFGICIGGMRQDGVVLDDIWAWRLGFRGKEVIGIRFSPLSASLVVSIESYPYLGRLGGTLTLMNKQLILIGGIPRCGCLPRDYEVMSISGDFERLADPRPIPQLAISALAPYRTGPRALLVGHEAVAAHKEVLIVGGGAVCFSFGTFWNDGIWALHDLRLSELSASPSSKKESVKEWIMLDVNSTSGLVKPLDRDSKPERYQQPLRVGCSTIESEGAFRAIVQGKEPTLLQEVDFGPCTKLWTMEYLKDKVGPDRRVIIHRAESRSMNFQKKNFTYQTQTFGKFLEDAVLGGHVYLRSIAPDKPTQQPADLSKDFPSLAGDFRLPPELRLVNATYHSSPLRISGAANMWLHYDTMANVLCQVCGQKRMILYPPADLQYLDFPPGASTSRLEVFEEGEARKIRDFPNTHPVEAVLHPGEILFIPPLWSHAGAPLEPLESINVAVNVFFRNLVKSGYAAGKDVYGNRDLQAYEDGRRDVEKIVRRFDAAIPRDVTQAYLLRLADEIRLKAEALDST